MLVNPRNVQALRAAIQAGECTGDFLPSVYVVEPVSRCNLQCAMCPNSKMAPSNWGDIDIEKFCLILDLIAPHCEFLMLYWMGEPLLHEKFELLIREARERTKGRIVISSNMTFMTESIADAILANADVFLCCIDRWNKSAYERIRHGANFESTIKNTMLLLSRKQEKNVCEVIIKALDVKQNTEEHMAFSQFWKAHGATPMLAWLNDWAGSLPGVRKAAQIPIPLASNQRIACADLWFKMVVNWRGEVQLCCFDWNYSYSLGHIDHAASINSIWHSEKIISLRKEQLSKNWKANSLCTTCTSWGQPHELDAYVEFDEESYFIIF